MKEFLDKFITIIIIILIVLIIAGTTYFCLDIFEIIDVPKEYSIASLFYSQIEVIAASGEDIANEIITSDGVKEIRNIVRDKKEEVQSNEAPSLSQLGVSYDNKIEKQPIVVNNIMPSSFYYEQLDEYAKILYNELYRNMDKLKTGTYVFNFDKTFDELLHTDGGSDLLNNDFQLAINALMFDNPDLFYIDITKMYLLTEVTKRAFTTTYRVSISGHGSSYLADNFNTTDIAISAIDNIEQIKGAIIEQTRGKNDIEKMRIVHDYLVDTIEYYSSGERNVYNIYGALVNKQAVCEGYARAYKDILDDIGIPCIIACGIGTNKSGKTENHAWNYVFIDEKWYAIDVTWDDPIINGGGTLPEEDKYNYFLKGSGTFFEDHLEVGDLVDGFRFYYPELSLENY